MRRFSPQKILLPAMLILPALLVLLFEGLKGQKALMDGWVSGFMAPAEQWLGRLWSVLPFSVAEVLTALFLAGSVFWVVRAVVLVIRRREGRGFLRRLLALASVLLWLWAAFCWLWNARPLRPAGGGVLRPGGAGRGRPLCRGPCGPLCPGDLGL